jgi:GNAT superfamily N-acetyltransferase
VRPPDLAALDGLLIRSAEPRDAAAIAAVHVEGWEEFRAFVPEEVMGARTPESREREWSAYLASLDPRSSALVAEINGAVAGFCDFKLLDEPVRGARSEIMRLFVAARFRGHGVGRRLLAEAARRIRDRGGEPISLYSFTRNRFRGVYASLGGREAGERSSEWDGVVIPETCYLWTTADALIRSCAGRRRARDA